MLNTCSIGKADFHHVNFAACVRWDVIYDYVLCQSMFYIILLLNWQGVRNIHVHVHLQQMAVAFICCLYR